MTTTTIIDEEVKLIKLDDILPNPEQPRKDLNQEDLQTLPDSIQSKGLRKPIDVYQLPNGKYELIDGDASYNNNNGKRCLGGSEI